MGRKVLLACGIASSALYAAMNVIVAGMWDGYSSASQTVSELSAIGAPTRQLWVLLGIPYGLLATAFAYGVYRYAGANRRLRAAGVLLLVNSVLGFGWFFVPMHLRGAEMTATDVMHIVFGVVTVTLMFATIAVGGSAFGRKFRLYSIATLAVFVVCGALTFLDAPELAANQPTPWIGVWERINIGAFLLWIVVLAAALWPRTRPHTAELSAAGAGFSPRLQAPRRKEA